MDTGFKLPSAGGHMNLLSMPIEKRITIDDHTCVRHTSSSAALSRVLTSCRTRVAQAITMSWKAKVALKTEKEEKFKAKPKTATEKHEKSKYALAKEEIERELPPEPLVDSTDTDKEEVSLPSWVIIGQKCWWHLATTPGKWLEVQISEIDLKRHVVLVHFIKNAERWKSVPFGWIGKPGCPLCPQTTTPAPPEKEKPSRQYFDWDELPDFGDDDEVRARLAAAKVAKGPVPPKTPPPTVTVAEEESPSAPAAGDPRVTAVPAPTADDDKWMDYVADADF